MSAQRPAGRSDADGAPGARERILGRIREAVESRARVAHPGEPPGVGEGPGVGEAPEAGVVPGASVAPTVADAPELAVTERFARTLQGSGGEVVTLRRPDEAAGWLQRFAAGFGGAVVGADVPRVLRPALPEVEAAQAGLAVSVAVAGAAASGTVILSSREGRRLQLLAPVHLVWLEEGRLRHELASALDAARAAGELPAALGLHSGPSKSADIGRILVTGVHGPGRLVVAVTGFALADL